MNKNDLLKIATLAMPFPMKLRTARIKAKLPSRAGSVKTLLPTLREAPAASREISEDVISSARAHEIGTRAMNEKQMRDRAISNIRAEVKQRAMGEAKHKRQVTFRKRTHTSLYPEEHGRVPMRASSNHSSKNPYARSRSAYIPTMASDSAGSMAFPIIGGGALLGGAAIAASKHKEH